MPLLHYDKLLTSQNVVLDMPFYKNGLCDGGKAIDKSKYHNNATVTGAVWTPPYGYILDGIDDSINLGQCFSNGKSAFSIEIVAKFSENTLVRSLIGEDDTRNSFLGVELFRDGTTIYWDVGNGTTYGRSTATYAIGAYQHFICVYNGTNVFVYVNGIVGTTGILTGAIANAAANTLISSSGFGGGEVHFLGVVSEASIYNSALTQVQVTQHYLAAKRRLPWANLP